MSTSTALSAHGRHCASGLAPAPLEGRSCLPCSGCDTCSDGESASANIAPNPKDLRLLVAPKILYLSPAAFPGGIAMWGALPAVYNTSNAPDEAGVHVHARMIVGGTKQIDETFDLVQVELPGTTHESGGFAVNGDDASRYNVATILGVQLSWISCPACGEIHSDHDAGLVHPHRLHRCETCGNFWLTGGACVSNPVMLLKELCGDGQQNRPIIDPVERVIDQPQHRFPGGIQIWGSNPAIVWTSSKPEEGGLHFHAFCKRTDTPDVDETYGTVTLDGIALDAEQVRHYMAQSALVELEGRVHAMRCPRCDQAHFDRFVDAVSPHCIHRCEGCSYCFESPDAVECVSNPIVDALAKLETNRQNEDI